MRAPLDELALLEPFFSIKEFMFRLAVNKVKEEQL
jgi:hypothetical protein